MNAILLQVTFGISVDSIAWSDIFNKLEVLLYQPDLKIEFYSISQVSLEDVFNDIARENKVSNLIGIDSIKELI